MSHARAAADRTAALATSGARIEAALATGRLDAAVEDDVMRSAA